MQSIGNTRGLWSLTLYSRREKYAGDDHNRGNPYPVRRARPAIVVGRIHGLYWLDAIPAFPDTVILLNIGFTSLELAAPMLFLVFVD